MGLFDFLKKKKTIEPLTHTKEVKSTNIIRKARGTKIPKQAQRIFLSYDAHNSNDRDSLIADLLSMDAGMDCVVSYLEMPGADSDENLLKNELQDTQALVLWVTKDLLQTMRDGVFPVEYRIAQELHTPILPIANYGELFPEFTRLAGAIHGIARSDGEYRTKLKAQLETFLASEELIKEIQKSAFTAEMFLSYRKMDIDEARRFMKEFHDLKEFEAVSIWYDNFLTAGRIFDEEIRESISQCDVFTLLTTPNLLKKNDEGKDNYVVSTEYPYAVKQGKSIVSVESIPIKQTDFAVVFPDMKTVSLDNPAALYTAFRNKMKESARLEQLDSERAYLLGMAYFKGFGVERDIERAVRLLEISSEDCSPYALKSAIELAEIYQDGIGTDINYYKAVYWRAKAIVLSEQVLGLEHPETASSYNNIAGIYTNQGVYQESLKWLRKALVIKEKVLGTEHPDTALAYNNIAGIYTIQGNYRESLEWLQKALTIDENVFGKEHPVTAKTYSNIAGIYSKQGNYEKALTLRLKALDIFEKTLGVEHPDTALTYNSIGFLHFNKSGDCVQALEFYQKALTIREKVLGKEHPDTATTYSNIGFIYYQQNDDIKAIEWHEKALAIREKIFGTEHPDTAISYGHIAAIYQKQGNYTKAQELYQIALEINEKILGNEHPETASSYCNIGAIYYRKGNYPKAHELLQKALIIYEKVLGTDHPNTANIYAHFAELYDRQKDYTAALKWHEKVLSFRKKAFGAEHPNTSFSYNNIAVVYAKQGNYSESLELFLYAFVIRLRFLGEDHEATKDTFKSMKDVFIAIGCSEADFAHWLGKNMKRIGLL